MLKRETIFMDDRRIAGEGGAELIVHDGVTFRSNEPIRVSAAFLDGNTNSWQFVGYHTYDGIIELTCEIFPKATSIVLELKRTITVPGRTMVAKLSIISLATRSRRPSGGSSLTASATGAA